jgi:GrpB-like predicted nucleotidyltransferase (UPF0157 family)
MPVVLVPHDSAWSAQFGLKVPKLLEALAGWAWEGGVVFALEQIGSTSIPDLVAKPRIDIAVALSASRL